jgi:hypothetical protein
MSLYANVVGHWGAYEAAKAEEKLDEAAEKSKEKDDPLKPVKI